MRVPTPPLPLRVSAVVATLAAAGTVLAPLSATAAAPATSAGTSATSAAVAAPDLSRIAGVDRYATSVEASRRAFPTGTTAPVVYLVSGTSRVEGYGAIAAAAAQGGSVLLTSGTGIPAAVASELDRLDPTRVVLVGGTTTLATAVAQTAARYTPTVERVSGGSASGTSQALNRTAFTDATKAWVVTGASPNDAVIGATAAGAHRSPVIVLDGSRTGLPSANASLLRDLGVTSVTIVGSTAAVSAGIESDLESIVGSANVVRASGSDRYAVAARVNSLAWPSMAPGTAYLANGRETTNAFAGALLAARQKRPLYYTVPFCVPASTRPALAGPGVTRLTLLGGEASVRVLAGRLEACRSIDTASSVWALVNKQNPLSPKSYVPSNLVVPSMSYANGHRMRSDAAAALARMATASVAEGAGRLGMASGYRSYATQRSLYDARVASHGQAYADTWVMRPGYSEHQTGLTADLTPIGRSNETPQGVWLARNAWRFGFILRYEKDRTPVTGVGFEPWHFRFVGMPLAKGYHDGGWHTYEQFLDEPAAPTY
jgi:D-alanyl-D-alanine carboxypeptidase